MRHDNAPEIIREVFSIAPDAWLFGATLLGPIRDGKIVPWDKDVDLGIDSSKVTPQMIERFIMAGFKVSGIYMLDMPEMEEYIGPENMGKYGKFILTKHGVKVEMCCFTKGKDLPDRVGHLGDPVPMLYYASGTPRFFVMPEAFVYPLKKMKIYGFEVNVAERANDQLEFVYGADWKTPREQWYFTADHYLRREHTIIELKGDDGSRWSKWTGRKQVEKEYGPQQWPDDINTPPDIVLIKNI